MHYLGERVELQPLGIHVILINLVRQDGQAVLLCKAYDHPYILPGKHSAGRVARVDDGYSHGIYPVFHGFLYAALQFCPVQAPVVTLVEEIVYPPGSV